MPVEEFVARLGLRDGSNEPFCSEGLSVTSAWRPDAAPRMRGFTPMELMLTVGLIGVLMGIAVRRTRVTASAYARTRRCARSPP